MIKDYRKTMVCPPLSELVIFLAVLNCWIVGWPRTLELPIAVSIQSKWICAFSHLSMDSKTVTLITSIIVSTHQVPTPSVLLGHQKPVHNNPLQNISHPLKKKSEIKAPNYSQTYVTRAFDLLPLNQSLPLALNLLCWCLTLWIESPWNSCPPLMKTIWKQG